MDTKEFFLKLKQHCMQEHQKRDSCNCAQCRYQTFCYTPPLSLSETLVDQIQKSLVKD